MFQVVWVYLKIHKEKIAKQLEKYLNHLKHWYFGCARRFAQMTIFQLFGYEPPLVCYERR